MKNLIELRGVITKDNDEEISENEYDRFMKLFLDLVDDNGYNFNGGFKLLTEKEYLKTNK